MRKHLHYVPFVVSLIFVLLLGEIGFKTVNATTQGAPATVISGDEVDLGRIVCDGVRR
jgi:hypothetical protein